MTNSGLRNATLGELAESAFDEAARVTTDPIEVAFCLRGREMTCLCRVMDAPECLDGDFQLEDGFRERRDEEELP